MARTLTLSNPDEVDSYLDIIELSSIETLKTLTTISSNTRPVDALSKLKFDQVGKDPLDPTRPLNLIEQLNQTFTYIATLRAAKWLYEIHRPLGLLTLKMGAIGGTDIESAEHGGIAAEVFAAVLPTNNNKLNKDIEKVATTDAKHQYVFFMCPEFERGERPHHASFPLVQVFSLGGYTDAT